MQKVILKYCALKFVFNYIQSGVGAPPTIIHYSLLINIKRDK